MLPGADHDQMLVPVRDRCPVNGRVQDLWFDVDVLNCEGWVGSLPVDDISFAALLRAYRLITSPRLQQRVRLLIILPLHVREMRRDHLARGGVLDVLVRH